MDVFIFGGLVGQAFGKSYKGLGQNFIYYLSLQFCKLFLHLGLHRNNHFEKFCFVDASFFKILLFVHLVGWDQYK